ncbi:MAG: L,D-transpeptidase [Candidatus Levyibacteriota bacterium]
MKFISFSFSAQQLVFVFLAFIAGIILGAGVVYYIRSEPSIPAKQTTKESYWLLLHRKSNREFLYKGIPGDEEKSMLVKEFTVKTGIPGEKPTPLPHLLRREYWVIIGKMEARDNPETAPYFLTLDVPSSDLEPYGPTPYVECGGQCNWELFGDFGLHGVNGDMQKLSKDNPGSSGCIRHSDQDITYLYNLLDPNKEEVRYYIKDI